MIHKTHDTTKIDALAAEIIADAKARDLIRQRRNEAEMIKLECWLASGSLAEGGSQWTH